MARVKVRCPECDERVRVAVPPAGVRARCPECDARFPLPDEDGEAGEPDDRDEPRPRPRRSTGKSGGRRGLVLGLIVGGAGLVLLVGLVAAGYSLWPRGPSSGAFGLTGGRGDADAALTEAIDILIGVRDRASAEAARPRLTAVGQRLRQCGQEPLEVLRQHRDDGSLRDRPEVLARVVLVESLRIHELRTLSVSGGKEMLRDFYAAWGQPFPADFDNLALLAANGLPPPAPPLGPDAGSGRTPLPPSGAAAREAFDKVHNGMTEAEVTALLGPPSASHRRSLTINGERHGSQTMLYHRPDLDCAIFLTDSKVTSKRRL